MEEYTYILQIPHSYYGVKYPTLNETMDYLNISFDLIQNKMNKVFELERLDEGYYHDARFDVIATMYAYTFYKKIDAIEMYKSISRRIERIKRASDSMVNLQDIFNNNYFGEDFEREFCLDSSFDNNSDSLISDIEHHLNRIKVNIEKIEDVLNEKRKLIQRNKDLKVKEYVESKLLDMDNIEIIKAVFQEFLYDENCIDRVINFDFQLLDDVYGELNVDLIKLEDNTYLMIKKDKSTSIIKVNKDCVGANGYKVDELNDCPEIRFYNKDVTVKSYSTKLGEYPCPLSCNNNNDDEIPF